MSARRFGWWWGVSVVLAGLVLAIPFGHTPAALAQGGSNGSLPQRFVALAANLSNVNVGPAAQTVEIQVTRWSTDAERDRLLTVLKEKGEKALLSELQKLPKVGSIRTPDSLGYDLHFARQHPWGDGGRRIFIATDRYITFWEQRNQARSLDYPFTLIEMRLDNHDRGEGKLTLATSVSMEDNQLVLENYANQPIMLKSVHAEK
jgi:hypothetical protein